MFILSFDSIFSLSLNFIKLRSIQNRCFKLGCDPEDADQRNARDLDTDESTRENTVLFRAKPQRLHYGVFGRDFRSYLVNVYAKRLCLWLVNVYCGEMQLLLLCMKGISYLFPIWLSFIYSFIYLLVYH